MNYMNEYKKWKESPYLTPGQKAELEGIAEGEILDRFCMPLSFGTSGLRGVVGIGINRLNVFTLLQSIRAYARSLPAGASVVVCRDARLSSDTLARAAACALWEEGVRVLWFENATPTPVLSFAVRFYGADGGINITASHNPQEYNGCKFYGPNGALLGSDDTDRIFEIMQRTPMLAPLPECDLDSGLASGEVKYARCIPEYINTVLECRRDESLLQNTDLCVVYTPLHGVGGSVMPEVFDRAGLKKVCYVAEQMEPDGHFPTIPNPNPEDTRGFALSEKLGQEVNADILIATDPDADRIAASVRDKDGRFVPLSANKTAALLCDYMLRNYQGENRPVIIKTIVSTHLVEAVCRSYGAGCYSTFTGFKNMAEKLEELPSSETCLMCYEEAIGYMIGTKVRDKDGISTSLLICEMAAWYRTRGMTLLDGLQELHKKYGEYDDYTVNLVRKGVEGTREIADMMEYLRHTPPESIDGLRVTERKDYLSGENTHIKGSNVLEYRLEGGSRLSVRPSGTEPKIKIYALTINHSPEALAQAMAKRLTDR